MALQLTLSKENNFLYYDFIDAYWRIEDINYDTTMCNVTLVVYPNREARDKHKSMIQNYTISVGASLYVNYQTHLYLWNLTAPLASIFPNGIPLNENEQKTAIYNYIKAYTGLPFVDIFEPENLSNQ